jgi:hypothetical protein
MSFAADRLPSGASSPEFFALFLQFDMVQDRVELMALERRLRRDVSTSSVVFRLFSPAAFDRRVGILITDADIYVKLGGVMLRPNCFCGESQEVIWSFLPRAETKARGGFEPPPVPDLEPLPKSEEKRAGAHPRRASSGWPAPRPSDLRFAASQVHRVATDRGGNRQKTTVARHLNWRDNGIAPYK